MSFGMKHKTKASRQSQSMLHGYRQLYSKYKNIFLKILQMMLEKDLTHQAIKLKDLYQQVKVKKSLN